MELYVTEKPKECNDCIFCEKYRYGRRYCSLNGIDLGCFDRTKECPLKTLAEHSAEKDAKIKRLKKSLDYACDAVFDETLPYEEIQEMKQKYGKHTVGIILEDVLFYYEKLAEEEIQNDK